jgi:5-methylcytosine-specific restriction endonuclease McrA
MGFRWVKRTLRPDPTPEPLRVRVLKKTNGRDWYDGKRLDPKRFHVDHFVSRNRGGQDTFDNLVPTSPENNVRKSSHDIEEFRQIEIRRKQASGGIFRKRRSSHQFWFERKKLNP